MSLFDQITAEFRASLTFADDNQVSSLLHQALIELGAEADEERAEMRAYKICGCCRRIYTQEQWEALPASSGGLHKRDDDELSEWRNCSTPDCASTLVVVLETYGGYPHKGSRRETRLKDDKRPSWCGACDTPIAYAAAYVVYLPRSAGRQQAAPQVFCVGCDATARFGR